MRKMCRSMRFDKGILVYLRLVSNAVEIMTAAHIAHICRKATLPGMATVCSVRVCDNCSTLRPMAFVYFMAYYVRLHSISSSTSHVPVSDRYHARAEMRAANVSGSTPMSSLSLFSQLRDSIESTRTDNASLACMHIAIYGTHYRCSNYFLMNRKENYVNWWNRLWCWYWCVQSS